MAWTHFFAIGSAGLFLVGCCLLLEKDLFFLAYLALGVSSSDKIRATKNFRTCTGLNVNGCEESSDKESEGAGGGWGLRIDLSRIDVTTAVNNRLRRSLPSSSGELLRLPCYCTVQ